MPTESPLSVAYAALARRDMTAKEVASLLEKKGFSEEESAGVVASLCQLGLVQDERTAGFVVAEVKSSRFKGRLSAAEKLEKRGVAPATATEALVQLDPQEDLLKAKLFVLSKPWKNRSQAARALATRGFEEECILSVIEETFPEE
ncbi:MAG: regulatory protein RecX [Armatimonadota bacterium]